jgi:hypothetical protein
VLSQRQEGLLNPLSEVKVSKFVPTFVKPILCTLENSESCSNHFSGAQTDIEDSDVKINDSHEHELENEANKSGKIHSMCFLRLSDFLSQFSETIERSTFGPALWSMAGPARKNLPNNTNCLCQRRPNL